MSRSFFCKHRMVIVKRWEIDKKWYVIERCRWCDKWQRKTIELSETAFKTTPKLINEKFVVDDPTISPEEKARYESNYKRVKRERQRESQRLKSEGK